MGFAYPTRTRNRISSSPDTRTFSFHVSTPGLTGTGRGQTPAPATGQPPAPGQPPVIAPPPAGTVTPQPPGVPPQASGNPFDIDTTVRAAIASSSSIAIAQRNLAIGQN